MSSPVTTSPPSAYGSLRTISYGGGVQSISLLIGPTRLRLRPVSLRGANDFVADHDRHHCPTRGHKFAIGVADDHGALRGVAIAGRPVARLLDDGLHLEILRVATDGTPNACSLLYGAVARAGAAVGYRRSDIVTYTLATEAGISLRAAGWVPVARTSGQTWDRPGRSRTDRQPTVDKIRWHAACPNLATVLDLPTMP